MPIEKRKIKANGDIINKYTAIIKQENDWWIGWIEEIPGVNCQEKTKDELIETLKVTLKEILDMHRQEAIANAGSNFQEIQITV